MNKIFRRIGVVMMTLSMFTFSSCEELKELLKFDFDLEGEAIEIVIEPTEEGNQQEIGSEQFEKSLEQIIKENAPDADLSKIKAINLTNISAEIVAGNDEDNSFQNFSEIFVSVNADGMGEDAFLVGKSTIGDEATRLDVPVEGGSVDVKNYFNKRNFAYVLKADVVKETTKPMRIRIKADYSFTFSL